MNNHGTKSMRSQRREFWPHKEREQKELTRLESSWQFAMLLPYGCSLMFHTIWCLTPAASKMSHPTRALNAANLGLQPSDPIEVVVLYYAQGLCSKKGQMDLGSFCCTGLQVFWKQGCLFGFLRSKPSLFWIGLDPYLYNQQKDIGFPRIGLKKNATGKHLFWTARNKGFLPIFRQTPRHPSSLSNLLGSRLTKRHTGRS